MGIGFFSLEWNRQKAQARTEFLPLATITPLNYFLDLALKRS
jgi:hypothetical protein